MHVQFFVRSVGSQPKQDLHVAVSLWYNGICGGDSRGEKSQFIMNRRKRCPTCENCRAGDQCPSVGHYTQLTWGTTTGVGCAAPLSSVP